ncbi:MAG: ROK family transcriptional regulator [Oscillospiraceae bacterium]
MNKKSERKQNLLQVIESMRRLGPMTQARLKECCGLQASTVSYLVNDLKQCNLIKDLGLAEQEGKVGKPGNLISLNNDCAAFLGVYVEDERLFSYLIGIDGTTVECDEHDFTDSAMEQTILEVIGNSLALHPQIRGVGITIKAIVYNDGTIKSGIRHRIGGEDSAWNFTNLSAALRGAFPAIPIIVENDANSAAEQYHYENKLENGNLVVYLLNHTPFGIGCGLMINGSIYRGHSGAAGEFFEKNTKIGEIARQSNSERDFIEKFLPQVMSHAMETAYLLDPECIVLTGSYFEHIEGESVAQIEQLFKGFPVPVVLACGEKRLNPAKGVALLSTNAYVADFVEEVIRR